MNTITLANGTVTLVDEDDFVRFGHISWSLSNGYVQNTIQGQLHRLIMSPASGLVVDHINGDKLDNRKHNLRTVRPHVNRLNAKDVTARTLPPNVYLRPNGQYQAKFMRNRQIIHCGTWNTLEEAAGALIRNGYLT